MWRYFEGPSRWVLYEYTILPLGSAAAAVTNSARTKDRRFMDVVYSLRKAFDSRLSPPLAHLLEPEGTRYLEERS